jgi:predicted O-methyltransferase YrrM
MREKLMPVRNVSVNREAVAAYLLANNPPEHPAQIRLRTITAAMPMSHMQIGPEIAQFLQVLARLIDARQVLEVGTFTGYSALALALAVPDGGSVVTCDVDAGMASVGRPLWEEAGVASKIQLQIGPARLTLENLLTGGRAASFDMMFIDANKEDYDTYYESGLKLVRLGGVMVLDNMLRRGMVLDGSIQDPSVLAVHRLSEKIAADDRVDRVLLPIGDGMTLVHVRG